MNDEAFLFDCKGATLVGVLSRTDRPATTGVLILVGGPQTRVGSHRQFALLARALAAGGVPTLRFDFRGMGDSEGEAAGFEAVDDDIAAALDAFQRACPALRRFVLWGLCDAASAALLYWRRRRDKRIVGLALLNPWVRSEAGHDRALLRHYYLDRLCQPAFWRKLFGGGLAWRSALGEAWLRFRRVRRSGATTPSGTPSAFRDEMAAALQQFDGAILVVIAGNDLTGLEFADWGTTTAWRQRPMVRWHDIAGEDHTFSSAAGRDAVSTLTLDWARTLEAPR